MTVAMRRWSLSLVAVIVATACSSKPAVLELTLVGHSDLNARGMNAAIAIVGDVAYVGSRTEGETHAGAGVLIVDITNPATPIVVGEIGAPDESLLGMTSRELRAVPDKNLLIVLNFPCSTVIHACTRDTQRFPNTGGAAEASNLKFYDVSNPRQPTLITTHVFPQSNTTGPHEFFLWRDPGDPDRILLYLSMPLGPPALQVLDISDLGNISLVVEWDPQDDGGLDELRGPNTLLHSVSVSADGQVGYLSYESAGLLLIDTSVVTGQMAAFPTISLLHPVANRVDYSPPAHPGTHSAVEIPGRNAVLVTDEVYPLPRFDGCPWGWARFVDTQDVVNPRIVSEYRALENNFDPCPEPAAQDRKTFSAHNATVTENLAFITWHSAGFHVVDTSDLSAPRRLIEYFPDPLPTVAVEDPALGGHQVLMWSTPIIKDGLIYVVDIRNGLYIFRYQGPHEREVSGLGFAEGNSNLR